MDQKTAILHISDLHIADIVYTDNIPSKFQKDSAYLEQFIKKILELSEDINIKYLIVSGDLTQSASEEEYAIALDILNEICDRVKINKKNVMITPGNHDINWSNFIKRLKDLKINRKEEFYKYSKEKFQEFKEFYDEFFNGVKIFDPDKVILDSIVMEDNQVVLLGINSIYHESNLRQDHKGYIDIQGLKKELADYERKLEYKTTFGVMHHTPVSIGDEVGTIENWSEAIVFFKSTGIKNFLCGHTHVSNSSLVSTKESLSYFITGSIGLDEKEINNTFLVLETGEDDKKNKGFFPMYYKWEKERGEEGYWQSLSNKSNSLPFVVTEDKKGIGAMTDVVTNIESNEILQLENENTYSNLDNKMETNEEYDTEIERFLLDTIKENDLYISGHFHWSKSGRSHSFIKTNYFFENYECIEKVKICFMNLINKNKIETDLLIGYAMQGSAIGSLIAIEKNWKYTYCPAVGKKYSEYEKAFPEGKHQYVTVIIDLVYTGNIIKWLVKKLQEKYKSLRKVTICTLFYTNCERLSSYKYLETEIDFFYVYQININTCPYKNKNDCIVYKENLDTVHILYSEEEK